MSTLSEPVQDLIRRSIDSVVTLDLLLLLHRAQDSYWTSTAAEQILGLKPASAKAPFETLVSAGLAQRGTGTGAYRYAAADELLARAVDQLCDACTRRRGAVISLIHALMLNR